MTSLAKPGKHKHIEFCKPFKVCASRKPHLFGQSQIPFLTPAARHEIIAPLFTDCKLSGSRQTYSTVQGHGRTGTETRDQASNQELADIRVMLISQGTRFHFSVHFTFRLLLFFPRVILRVDRIVN